MGQIRYVVLLMVLFVNSLSGRAQAQISTEAGEFDNGKMWTFEYAPADYFDESYDFDADQDWFSEARLGTLRIPGCTASFVSSYGLVLTNHHCSRTAVSSVSLEGEELLDNGFYANSIAEERAVPGMYADQLIAIEDVTDEVFAAEDSAQTDAERVQFREDAIQQISDRLKEASGLGEDNVVIEVVPLYHGGRYSAYTFKRYTDMRLVLAPEMKIGYFGGDTDNFTFPRYTLDFTLFRIYEDDQPFETEHYFVWSLEGVRNEEPVFVIGNPGSTSRLETVAQLELRRDVTDLNLYSFLETRIDALESIIKMPLPAVEQSRLRNALFSLKNARKAYKGQLEALNDEGIMARRQDAEIKFIDALKQEGDLADNYAGIIDEMAAVQKDMAALKSEHGAFFAFTSQTYSSALLRRGLLAYRYLGQREQGGENEQLQILKDQISAIPDQSETLGKALLTARLKDFRMYFGEDDTMVSNVLDGHEPGDRADKLFASSSFATQSKSVEFLDSGLAIADDPGLQIVAYIMEKYQDYQSAFAGLQAKQDAIASRIGRARFAVYGTEIPPDATFSLRIADGRVRGYSYNGTVASPFTSFFGMYDHYYSYGPSSEWDLPQRWLEPIRSFDRGVPLNFSSTNDIIGGNSGSPVINRDLELVGLIFDGNIESLSGNYIYLPETNRAVSVDARGILEALDEVYQANRLVLELTKDEMNQLDASN